MKDYITTHWCGSSPCQAAEQRKWLLILFPSVAPCVLYCYRTHLSSVSLCCVIKLFVCVAACSDRSSPAPTRLHSWNKQQRSSWHLFLVSFSWSLPASLLLSPANYFNQMAFVKRTCGLCFGSARVGTKKRRWSQSNADTQSDGGVGRLWAEGGVTP